MTGANATFDGNTRDLTGILACPNCHGDLTHDEALYRCIACGQSYPQTAGYLQLMPRRGDEVEAAGWQSRQEDMQGYYDDMISSPAKAAETILKEGAELAPLLARFSSRILDIGGGSGLMRLFAPNATSYVVIEPETYWFGERWQSILADRQRHAAALLLVQGTGENLPFKAQMFDGAISLWSLNHARQPSAVIEEASRVLRPGAPFTLLLEDMEPGAIDIFVWLTKGSCTWRQAVYYWARRLSKSIAKGGAWHVGPDHIRITEADMAEWTSGRFELEGRQWIDRYLALEYRRL